METDSSLIGGSEKEDCLKDVIELITAQNFCRLKWNSITFAVDEALIHIHRNSTPEKETFDIKFHRCLNEKCGHSLCNHTTCHFNHSTLTQEIHTNQNNPFKNVSNQFSSSNGLTKPISHSTYARDTDRSSLPENLINSNNLLHGTNYQANHPFQKGVGRSFKCSSGISSVVNHLQHKEIEKYFTKLDSEAKYNNTLHRKLCSKRKHKFCCKVSPLRHQKNDPRKNSSHRSYNLPQAGCDVSSNTKQSSKPEDRQSETQKQSNGVPTIISCWNNIFPKKCNADKIPHNSSDEGFINQMRRSNRHEEKVEDDETEKEQSKFCNFFNIFKTVNWDSNGMFSGKCTDEPTAVPTKGTRQKSHFNDIYFVEKLIHNSCCKEGDDLCASSEKHTKTDCKDPKNLKSKSNRHSLRVNDESEIPTKNYGRENLNAMKKQINKMKERNCGDNNENRTANVSGKVSNCMRYEGKVPQYAKNNKNRIQRQIFTNLKDENTNNNKYPDILSSDDELLQNNRKVPTISGDSKQKRKKQNNKEKITALEDLYHKHSQITCYNVNVENACGDPAQGDYNKSAKRLSQKEANKLDLPFSDKLRKKNENCNCHNNENGQVKRPAVRRARCVQGLPITESDHQIKGAVNIIRREQNIPDNDLEIKSSIFCESSESVTSAEFSKRSSNVIKCKIIPVKRQENNIKNKSSIHSNYTYRVGSKPNLNCGAVETKSCSPLVTFLADDSRAILKNIISNKMDNPYRKGSSVRQKR